MNIPYPGGGGGSQAGPSATRTCSSSVAPMAMPTTGQPVTTLVRSPVDVIAVTTTAKQLTPESTTARASRRAERTSAWHRGAASCATWTSKLTGPSRSRSHPCWPRSRSHFGGDQPCDTPSMISSTPSTRRPARRPRIIGCQSGGCVGALCGSDVAVGAEPRKVLKVFALRGAPCGDWPDLTVPVHSGNEEQAVEGREPDESNAVLVGEPPVVLPPDILIILDRLRLLEADAVFAQVGSRLVRVPRLVHPRDRTGRRSPATHRGLRWLLPAVSRRSCDTRAGTGAPDAGTQMTPITRGTRG